jgi:hypothetical protein
MEEVTWKGMSCPWILLLVSLAPSDCEVSSLVPQCASAMMFCLTSAEQQWSQLTTDCNL